MNQQKRYEFPSDFIWGVATSAAQVEGAALEDGKGLSIWDVFSRIPDKTKDASTPDISCDHYHRYAEDIASMKALGIKSYRFSFSWPRVMPDGTGKINDKGLDFYKRLVDELLENDIIPNATLYHWDLPYELECRGGWTNRDCADWFADYASMMFQTFGDNIPLWSTINEPIATYVGYAKGVFAPGRKLELFGRQANHHILLAHGKAVEAFRAMNLNKAQIGIVVDIWNHHPARKGNAGDEQLALHGNEMTYRSFLNPIFKGGYSDYLMQYMEKGNYLPEIKEDDFRKIKSRLDFFGLNCYNRVVCSESASLSESSIRQSGGNFLENGSEFYPKAIYDALQILRNDYQVNIPIYITENGTCNCNEEFTADGKIHDTERIKYIKGFLKWLNIAMQNGANVKGYYLWSLLDNFEWSAGYSSRFGLTHVDFDTLQRTYKDSALQYSEIIRNSGFYDEESSIK
jgi:beta-glucosidase